MGFFDKLFGKAKPEKKEVKIALQELLPYIEGKTSEERQQVEKTVFSKFSEVKHNLAEIKAEMGEFRARDLETEEGNKRLRKIVGTAKKNLLQQMDSLIRKLKPPEKHDFSVLESYCLSSSSMLQREINTFGKNISYTGILMKKEIKTLGQYINELDSIFLELKKIFEGSRFAKAEVSKGKISHMKSLIDEKRELDSSIPVLEESINRLLEEKKLAAAAISEMQNSPLVKKLQRLTDEGEKLDHKKAALKAKFVDLLGTIDKPIKRFVKLVESRAYLIERSEEAALHAYLDSPFEAVKADPKAEKLKKLLSEIKKGITTGKISLKEKEKGKKIEAIDRLAEYDFFGGIFWELNRIDSESASLDKRIADIKISHEIEGASRNLEALDAEIGEKTNALQLIRDNSKRKEEQLESLKEEVEKVLSAAIGESIIVSLG